MIRAQGVAVRFQVHAPAAWRAFSTDNGDKRGDDKSKGIAPMDSFDDEVEDDKEFLDIMTALAGGGLGNLTTQNELVDPAELEIAGKLEAPEDFAALGAQDDDDDDWDESHADGTPIGDLADAMFPDDNVNVDEDEVNEHWARIEKDLPGARKIISNEDVQNMSLEAIEFSKGKVDQLHEGLDNFLPDTSPHKFPVNTPGKRHCSGKKQRAGKKGILKCHKIDLDMLSHLDVVTMRTFVSESAEIKPRRDTGLCAKCQRAVAKTIKRARNYGLMPNLDGFAVQDSRPRRSKNELHHDITPGGVHMESKTIS